MIVIAYILQKDIKVFRLYKDDEFIKNTFKLLEQVYIKYFYDKESHKLKIPTDSNDDQDLLVNDSVENMKEKRWKRIKYKPSYEDISTEFTKNLTECAIIKGKMRTISVYESSIKPCDHLSAIMNYDTIKVERLVSHGIEVQELIEMMIKKYCGQALRKDDF